METEQFESQSEGANSNYHEILTDIKMEPTENINYDMDQDQITSDLNIKCESPTYSQNSQYNDYSPAEDSFEIPMDTTEMKPLLMEDGTVLEQGDNLQQPIQPNFLSDVLFPFSGIKQENCDTDIPELAYLKPKKTVDKRDYSKGPNLQKKTSISKPTRKRHPKGAIFEVTQAHIVPIEQGWKRELVYRGTSKTSSKRNGDVYYYTPWGQKLRSMKEVSEALQKANLDLTLDNFSFFKTPFGLNDPNKEIVREAMPRTTLSPKRKIENPRTTKSHLMSLSKPENLPSVKLIPLPKEILKNCIAITPKQKRIIKPTQKKIELLESGPKRRRTKTTVKKPLKTILQEMEHFETENDISDPSKILRVNRNKNIISDKAHLEIGFAKNLLAKIIQEAANLETTDFTLPNNILSPTERYVVNVQSELDTFDSNLSENKSQLSESPSNPPNSENAVVNNVTEEHNSTKPQNMENSYNIDVNESFTTQNIETSCEIEDNESLIIQNTVRDINLKVNLESRINNLLKNCDQHPSGNILEEAQPQIIRKRIFVPNTQDKSNKPDSLKRPIMTAEKETFPKKIGPLSGFQVSLEEGWKLNLNEEHPKSPTRSYCENQAIPLVQVPHDTTIDVEESNMVGDPIHKKDQDYSEPTAILDSSSPHIENELKSVTGHARNFQEAFIMSTFKLPEQPCKNKLSKSRNNVNLDIGKKADKKKRRRDQLKKHRLNSVNGTSLKDTRKHCFNKQYNINLSEKNKEPIRKKTPRKQKLILREEINDSPPEADPIEEVCPISEPETTDGARTRTTVFTQAPKGKVIKRSTEELGICRQAWQSSAVYSSVLAPKKRRRSKKVLEEAGPPNKILEEGSIETKKATLNDKVTKNVVKSFKQTIKKRRRVGGWFGMRKWIKKKIAEPNTECKDIQVTNNLTNAVEEFEDVFKETMPCSNSEVLPLSTEPHLEKKQNGKTLREPHVNGELTVKQRKRKIRKTPQWFGMKKYTKVLTEANAMISPKNNKKKRIRRKWPVVYNKMQTRFSIDLNKYQTRSGYLNKSPRKVAHKVLSCCNATSHINTSDGCHSLDCDQTPSEAVVSVNFNNQRQFHNLCVKNKKITKQGSLHKKNELLILEEDLELIKVPLDQGWKRELVKRTTPSNPIFDVYYKTPFGKKIRSMPEVKKYINGSTLTPENFSFARRLFFNDPEKEILRQAFPGGMRRPIKRNFKNSIKAKNSSTDVDSDKIEPENSKKETDSKQIDFHKNNPKLVNTSQDLIDTNTIEESNCENIFDSLLEENTLEISDLGKSSTQDGNKKIDLEISNLSVNNINIKNINSGETKHKSYTKRRNSIKSIGKTNDMQESLQNKSRSNKRIFKKTKSKTSNLKGSCRKQNCNKKSKSKKSCIDHAMVSKMKDLDTNDVTSNETYLKTLNDNNFDTHSTEYSNSALGIYAKMVSLNNQLKLNECKGLKINEAVGNNLNECSNFFKEDMKVNDEYTKMVLPTKKHNKRSKVLKADLKLEYDRPAVPSSEHKNVVIEDPKVKYNVINDQSSKYNNSEKVNINKSLDLINLLTSTLSLNETEANMDNFSECERLKSTETKKTNLRGVGMAVKCVYSKPSDKQGKSIKDTFINRTYTSLTKKDKGIKGKDTIVKRKDTTHTRKNETITGKEKNINRKDTRKDKTISRKDKCLNKKIQCPEFKDTLSTRTDTLNRRKRKVSKDICLSYTKRLKRISIININIEPKITVISNDLNTNSGIIVQETNKKLFDNTNGSLREVDSFEQKVNFNKSCDTPRFEDFNKQVSYVNSIKDTGLNFLKTLITIDEKVLGTTETEMKEKYQTGKYATITENNESITEKNESTLGQDTSLTRKDTILIGKDKINKDLFKIKTANDPNIEGKDSSLIGQSLGLVDNTDSIDLFSDSSSDDGMMTIDDKLPHIFDVLEDIIDDTHGNIEKETSFTDKDKCLKVKCSSLVKEDTGFTEKDTVLDKNTILTEENTSFNVKDIINKGRDTRLTENNKKIIEKDTIFKGKDVSLTIQDTSLTGYDTITEKFLIIVKDKIIKEKNTNLIEKYVSLEEKDTSILRNNTSIKGIDTRLTEKNTSPIDKDVSIDGEDVAIKGKDSSIDGEDTGIKETDTIFTEKDTCLRKEDNSLTVDDVSIRGKETKIIDYKDSISLFSDSSSEDDMTVFDRSLPRVFNILESLIEGEK